MIEAIKKLVEERPGIDGIALPGMPSPKRVPFTIYSDTRRVILGIYDS